MTGWLFGAAVLIGHFFLLVNPSIPAGFGFVLMDQPFLDSHAILAAGDALRAGLDPWKPHALDALGRPHCYSSWWLFSAELGLTRTDNIWLGSLWACAFILTALAVLQPRSTRRMLVAAAVLFSPPVLLGVNRANNDLPIFALLASGAILLGTAGRGAIWLFGGIVALATGLKFYPLAAIAGFLGIRPRSRALVAMLLTALLAAAALTQAEIGRALGTAPAPIGTLTFGHLTLLRWTDWSPNTSRAAASVMIAGFAWLCVRRGWAPRFSAGAESTTSGIAFLTGASVLTACFLLTGNYAYRLVFIVMVVPHLASANSGRGGRITLALLLALLWVDGLFCLLSAPVAGNLDAGARRIVENAWLLVSQPVAWLAVALLAAGLMEAGRSLLVNDGGRR